MSKYLLAFGYRGKPHLEKFRLFNDEESLINEIIRLQTEGTRDEQDALKIQYTHDDFFILELLENGSKSVRKKFIKKLNLKFKD